MSKYCIKCGKELPDDALFCDNCGTRMPAAANIPEEKPIRPTQRTVQKTERTGPKKGSFFSGLMKLILAAVILFGLFLGGTWLWNKIHYHPALDGDVYPGTNDPGSAVLSPPAASSEKEQETVSTPPIEQTQQNENPVISDDSFDFDPSRLHYSDFDEIYNWLMYAGIPEDRITEPLGQANGIWKYNLWINTDSGEVFNELGYAEVSVHDSNTPPVSVILHPRIGSNGNETWEETDQDVGYEPFSGGFDDNKNIKLIGNDCVLYLEYFFAYEGREYLSGKLWMSEESVTDLVFIRGQE